MSLRQNNIPNFLLSVFLLLLLLFFAAAEGLAQSISNAPSEIRGEVKSGGEVLEFALVYISGKENNTTYSGENGHFSLQANTGRQLLIVQLMGYERFEKWIDVRAGVNWVEVELTDRVHGLQELVVQGKSAVQQVRETPFNVVALDTRSQYNTTSNLSDALNRASGVRIRETGGVGSDMQLMVDGFSGRHVKVFIDGVPQEGVGSAFNLNNIPVNYAERIEVYKGVVPVGFATDAIGGVVNIITKQSPQKWYLDASYSFGSFNTHKTNINIGQTFKNGFTYELNAFQNYSDNNYYIDTPVKEFLPDGGSSTSKSKIERVKRFHDNYHNEAVVTKVGFVNKKWADRLIFNLTWSQLYKETQSGVRQEIVFGDKHHHGYSLLPSLEYRKKNFLTRGMELVLTTNFNRNVVQHVDTSSFEYNWRGEKRAVTGGRVGEQSHQNNRSFNNNWNGTLTARYQIGEWQQITFNHVSNLFRRTNISLLSPDASPDPIAKETSKNISGFSYRLSPNDRMNFSAFGKYYHQFAAGPLATTSTQDDFVRATKSTSTTGYGAVGTYFILKSLQSKFSYEKVYRLPTNTEMFGDEDLENGQFELRPESSNNFNFNLSFNEQLDAHSFYLEGGLIYRDIQDYIRRNIEGLGGGKFGATYVNHGKVLTKGYNVSARYSYSKWLSVGANFTEMNVRDNVETFLTGAPNLAYKARIPNIPYLFANTDLTFNWEIPGTQRDMLTFTYDNLYMKGFPLYSENLGSESKFMVPTQFAHNISLAYAMREGKCNLTLECQNLTDAKLYDNFSLQKPGRAFYAKFRVFLGNK